ncbi:MAG: hypothetical protein GF320_13750, partial [Armatimonadia bacterium]|nr:hypothetical protein [Armatimonadia bacterium]
MLLLSLLALQPPLPGQAVGEGLAIGSVSPAPRHAYPLEWSKTVRRLSEGECPLRAGEKVALRARHGLLMPSAAEPAIELGPGSVEIPSNGILAFAVDAPRPIRLRGRLRLEPDADLRPGLRYTVLLDDRVWATPMVRAEPWEGEGNAITGPQPDVEGVPPASVIELPPLKLRPGSHTIRVAGPHFRPAGVFHGLELTAESAEAEEPVLSFALLADTHLTLGPPAEWMNLKMGEHTADALGVTLEELKAEGIDFAIIAGDMTDRSLPGEFQVLADVVEAAGLRVLGCTGNHDVYRGEARGELVSALPAAFPAGAVDYATRVGPLRLVVMDSMDRSPARIEWLRDTLAADTETPTLFVCHYPVRNLGGASTAGFRLQDWSFGGEVLSLLRNAPNVLATLTGHT